MTQQQHILEALEMICCRFDSPEDMDLSHIIDDQSHLLSGGECSESFEECHQ
jgi:hypothetical protein